MPLLTKSTPIIRYQVQAEERTDAIRAKVLEGLKANAMPEILGEQDTMIAGARTPTNCYSLLLRNLSKSCLKLYF